MASFMTTSDIEYLQALTAELTIKATPDGDASTAEEINATSGKIVESRFLEASKRFTDFVLEAAKNKTIDGLEISAAFFASLAEQYVAMVQNKIDEWEKAVKKQIEVTVAAVEAQKIQAISSFAVKLIEFKISRRLSTPIDLEMLPPEGLCEIAQPLIEATIEKYMANVAEYGIDDSDSLRRMLEERTERMEEEWQRDAKAKDMLREKESEIEALKMQAKEEKKKLNDERLIRLQQSDTALATIKNMQENYEEEKRSRDEGHEKTSEAQREELEMLRGQVKNLENLIAEMQQPK